MHFSFKMHYNLALYSEDQRREQRASALRYANENFVNMPAGSPAKVMGIINLVSGMQLLVSV